MLKQWGEREYATRPAGCNIIGSLGKSAHMDPWREHEITKHRDPQSSVGFGHSSLPKGGGWWWDRKNLRALEMRAGSCMQLAPPACPVPAKGHCSPVPLAGATSGHESTALCSLTRELPVCLKVLERHYIDYCLVFAGLQNVQGDTGKFREF